jgi:hypothetical protein
MLLAEELDGGGVARDIATRILMNRLHHEMLLNIALWCIDRHVDCQEGSR